ncbi:uncharacterized protein LOC131641903 [Vicia villosa]|uniref:uncharacterized protein LOC131641903 n=1 Tax=Vicia villosa TaxID=3911 RepID=UPI00273BCF59|nr:uncharacterized protein LOC131641903 [Vicia villosa]
MIILSLNIRGGGNWAKRKRVGFLIQKGDVDLCFIRETKLSGISLDSVRELWGGLEVEWSYLDANGAFGGILTMWKKDFFSLIYSFRGEGFLGLCVEKDGKLTYYVNVYASCDKITRRRTWKNLCDFKNNNTVGSWCIGVDFNSISTLDEKIGVTIRDYSRDTRSFNDFIEEMELVDLPTIGGERDVSDHAPIWLKNNRKDWGRKPFKFNNLWLNHEEFDNFVEEEWNKLEFKGIGDYCLVEKLKILKSRISWWNKTAYGWIDPRIDKDVKEMHSLDNLFIHFAGNAPEEVVEKRLKVVEDFWSNRNKKEGLLRLKSRQLWLTEGDDNT